MLLDTHIALWAIVDSPRLPPAARQMIADRQNDVLVSAASVWEIAIKHALARGGANDMPISGRAALGLFGAAGYGLLAITGEHAAAIGHLPPIHADPFDRMLVAQATTEPLLLITSDALLGRYSPTVIVVEAG